MSDEHVFGIVVPTREFIALTQVAAEVAVLACDAHTTHATEATRALRGLALAVVRRLSAVPTIVIQMPTEASKPEGPNRDHC